MKYTIQFLFAILFSSLAFSQKVQVTKEGFIKVIPDTIIVKKDSIIIQEKIVYVDKPVPYPVYIYKDTCIGKDTVIPPPNPGGVDYLNLPLSAKVVYTNRSNFTIENLRFENVTGAAITLNNCSNVTIKNCFFNRATEEAISVENCTNVTAEKNIFNGVATGLYALSSSSIKVINNQSLNPHVRPQGGRGNLSQFNGVSGTNVVENNVSVAWPGENDIEDHISLYNTSNVTVRGNTLVGGGPSTSGSGIMTGDQGGANQLIERNTLFNTGNAGIGVASGTNIRVLDNKIFGERTAVSNNPLYMWNQYTNQCSGNTIKDNYVNWTDKNGNKNNGWNAGNCSNSVYDPSQNKSISKSEMNIPADWNILITFLTPAEVNKIRGK